MLQTTIPNIYSTFSSLSVFSGLGTSSIVSGGSDPGAHIVIDELSDEQLARVVDDIRKNVKRIYLETKMFEGECGFCRGAAIAQWIRLRLPSIL